MLIELFHYTLLHSRTGFITRRLSGSGNSTPKKQKLNFVKNKLI